MKKAFLAAILAMVFISGCAASSDTITVISREDGSGTRGAFVELMGIESDGVDHTTVNAEISQSTSVVITSVEGNKNAIGYISLGSLNDTVKAIKVDGVEATVENIKNGTYAVSRPFNIAYKDDTLSELSRDFISYIMSADGQAIIEKAGCIKISENGAAYTPSGLTGTIKLGGSTSVAPVMEKLAEAYKALNAGVEITIEQTGSSAGMTSAIEGLCDIGMASRDVKQSELDGGLTAETIALDGIAVIVNKENSVSNLTSEQIKNIYVGDVTLWSEVQ